MEHEARHVPPGRLAAKNGSPQKLNRASQPPLCSRSGREDGGTRAFQLAPVWRSNARMTSAGGDLGRDRAVLQLALVLIEQELDRPDRRVAGGRPQQGIEKCGCAVHRQAHVEPEEVSAPAHRKQEAVIRRLQLARPDQGKARTLECGVQALDRVPHAADLLGSQLVVTAVANETDKQQPHERQQDRRHDRFINDVQ